MAHIGTGVEYALHCLLWLVSPLEQRPSSRDLAELQGVPAAFVAKIFSKLEKAGIVESAGGIRGGYQLARAPDKISVLDVLDVVDAVEGPKALFDCQEIRGRCALFEGRPPGWANRGVRHPRRDDQCAEGDARRTVARHAGLDFRRRAEQGPPCQFCGRRAGMVCRPPAGARRSAHQRHAFAVDP